MKRDQFKVSLIISEGASVGDIKIFIADAIKSLSGAFSHENPLFHLDRSSIKVTAIKAKKKLLPCPSCGKSRIECRCGDYDFD